MTEQDTPKMTHDEMIDALKGLVFGTFDRTTAKEREALDMAISALEKNESAEEWYKLLCEKWDSAEKEEQNIAIKYCHDHNLLMIPIDLYHTLNVTYHAFQNGITYEEAEKILLEEVKE